MNITTRHTSNSKGTGQVLARGGGKQRTLTWDHAASSDTNHGRAAGELLLAHFGTVGQPALDDLMSNITHTVKDDGSHRFTF